LKRSLRVVGRPENGPPSKPVVVRLGAEHVSLSDTGDGSAARRFARVLIDCGGVLVEREGAEDVDLRIVIRTDTPLESSEARLRVEVLEESADIVLGSVRPSFAQRLASRATSQNGP
jgi:hypothetical protein